MHSPIFIAGHRGMVGSAVCRRLAKEPGVQVITRDREQLDLTKEDAVTDFFETARPKTVIFASAKVGGIQANNDYRSSF